MTLSALNEIFFEEELIIFKSDKAAKKISFFRAVDVKF
jgi:hypothetical protein